MWDACSSSSTYMVGTLTSDHQNEGIAGVEIRVRPRLRLTLVQSRDQDRHYGVDSCAAGVRCIQTVMYSRALAMVDCVIFLDSMFPIKRTLQSGKQ